MVAICRGAPGCHCPALFCLTVTWLRRPIPSPLSFNLLEVRSSQWTRGLTWFRRIPALCAFSSGCVRAVAVDFKCFVMSTLGTLSYYADTHITHEADDHLASRYSPGTTLHQSRELHLTDYVEQEPCPFQTKSTIFGAPWSPIPDAALRASSSAYHPYAHQPCPAGEGDGMALRTWTLEPVSAPLSYSGLAMNVHNQIKPEPQSGVSGCTTLEPQVTDMDEDSCPADKVTPRKSSSFPQSSEENSAAAPEEKPDIDPSKSRAHTRNLKA